MRNTEIHKETYLFFTLASIAYLKVKYNLTIEEAKRRYKKMWETK